MVFNSLEFIFGFALFVLLYFLVAVKWRTPLIFVASIAFYAYYSIPLVLYLAACIVVTYYVGLRIQKQRDAGVSAKGWMLVGVIVNLGALAFYKYLDFIGQTIADICNGGSYTALQLVAPLGISFITFQAVSYVIDVYRGTSECEKSLYNFALYLSFFPKVIQGPIERAGDMLPQFQEEHRFNAERARAGFLMMLYGLFLKLAVADVAAVVVDTVFNSISLYNGFTIAMATVMFTFQIYCDFAGYSLIAIGTAKILGYDLQTNFSHPYLSKSPGEFWRRWHMTLNEWLKDYLYIPLGGSRCSKGRQRFNTLATFGLSGLWHGADWGYVIWGLLNGAYVAIEKDVKRFFKAHRREGKPEKKAEYGSFSNVLKVIGTFILISFGWLFFRARNLTTSFAAVKGIFTNFKLFPSMNYICDQISHGQGTMLYGLDVATQWPRLIFFLVVVIIMDVIADKYDLPEIIARGNRGFRWLIYLVLLTVIILFGAYGFGVSAGDFIYTGF